MKALASVLVAITALTFCALACEPFQEQCDAICCTRGAACVSLQCITGNQLTPSLGTNLGGTIVTMSGVVPDLPSLECLFEAGSASSLPVPATRISASAAVCISPASGAGTVGSINVKLQVSGQPAPNNSALYFYYPPMTLYNLTTTLAPITGPETMVRLQPKVMPPSLSVNDLCWCYIDFPTTSVGIPCIQLDMFQASCNFPAVTQYLQESTSVSVKLTLNGGQDNSTSKMFLFYANPVVSHVVPTRFPYNTPQPLNIYGTGFFYTGRSDLIVGFTGVKLTIVNSTLATATAMTTKVTPIVTFDIEMDGTHRYEAFSLPLDIACDRISQCGDCMIFNCSWCDVGGCQTGDRCADGSTAVHTCEVPGPGGPDRTVWIIIGASCGGAVVLAVVVVVLVCCHRRRVGYKTVI
eukprot:TRINITY_DN9884_c0_g1_i1.p1 TRINITY_DN9884_c0_g1~~TRINITY_DN9884_c0_g1_i1.p1  ORF type:complete len:410 (+),score=44.20 TRINITY_DN9884_c0_g1_i1:1053-2282(+)